MTDAERELLIMVVEGMISVTIDSVASARVEAGSVGTITRGGHPKNLREAFARAADAGEARIKRAIALLAEVRRSTDE